VSDGVAVIWGHTLKIILNICLVLDLDAIKAALITNPAARLKDVLSFDFWIEKKR